ncbi:zf-HC2 domain-containing protein [Tissierella sp.]|uniref:anti-sigma factor family protein n=1 Tax=Tissierella sp. TaxID=41274 RepID=UPI002859DF3D|nr:zf-HC2 domain-containing protein [Tissierella sp.]MDR7855616.1 zf-HC2 domain-containing protein [Tissierella sp.]
MTNECLNISDFIIAYINNTISNHDKTTLLEHLADCPDCREELAITIALSQTIAKDMMEVPDDVLESAFNMIAETKGDNSSFKLSDIKSLLEPLNVIPYALSTTRKSIKLALQFI